MSDVQAYSALSDLITALEDLCMEGSTGTVFIATEDNHLARLSLEAGQIRFISFHNKHGAAALDLMSNIEAGRLRFEDGQKTATVSADLPSTAEILSLLASQEGAAPSNNAVNSGGLTANDRANIEKILTDFIGPMAGLICEEHFDSATDMDSALQSLAAEIQDGAQAQQFIAQVRAKLKENH